MKKALIQSLILVIVSLGLFACFNKIASANDLATQLKGKILLQVESHGEAWYINPGDAKRYYLGRPVDAFNLMRTLGLGVSNADFAKFNGFAPKNLAGKILLKVQDKGQAYYANPTDLKLYYLGRPADAFNIMRQLGLGISNKNLDKISTHPTTQEQTNQINNNGQATNNQTNQGSSTIENNQGAIGEQNNIATSTNNNATTTPIISGDQNNQTASGTATTTCQFLANYFRNTGLIGDSVLSGYEDAINYDWGKSRGPLGLGRTNNFSARWTSNCNFVAGQYKFTAIFDDGMIVYVDGTAIITSWRDNVSTKTMAKEMEMTVGLHEIKVEYYKLENFGVAKLSWEKI
ncbi:MAG: PA14 domain-containing protein, partial [Candidatus Falkowbacteria bacterium]|nr:PA14 domain-containing protein [Candidatus Falkowbacteria bacterium]